MRASVRHSRTHALPLTPAWNLKNPFQTMAAAADYKVADITLADFGRKEIELAEAEMPGLMAARAEYGPPQTLKGASPYHTRLAFRVYIFFFQ